MSKRKLNGRILRLGLAATGGVALCATAAAQGVTRLETFGTWSLLVDDKTPHLACFVTATPQQSTPAAATREAPRAYISAWPKDGVKGEVSFRMGFPVKKDAEATASVGASVGATSVKLFAAGDKLFVADATQELKLIEAMKQGAQVIVKATSERGLAVTDTYALNRLSQALQNLQDTCF